MGPEFSDVSGDPIIQGITIAIAIMWSTNFQLRSINQLCTSIDYD